MAAHDSDPFNRWQAVQTLATALLVGNASRLAAGQDPEADDGLLAALGTILANKTLEPAFVAETARFLAKLRGVGAEELGRVTSENFARLFRLKLT